MIPQRKPHQSQLDYLWDNFANLKSLELKDGQLIGTNEAGESTLTIDFTGGLQADLSGLQQQVDANTKALQVLNDSKEGLVSQVLQEVTQYIDSQLIDVTEIKTKLNEISSSLQILNGSKEEEGSILNVVTSQIESAFNWQEI